MERLPPHSLEAEEAALGSIIIDGQAVTEVASWLKPEDFYDERNRWCYEACLSLFQRNEAIDQVTLAQELAARNRIEQMGGFPYLGHLVSAVPTSVHLKHYAQTIHNLALMRRLIAVAGEIAAIGYQAGPDAEEALRQAEDKLYSLRKGERPRGFVPIKELLGQYLDKTAWSQLPSVSSGFPELDILLGGLHPSDLVVLAARPSLGKSSLALNIARNAAVEEEAHVAIFSLEMGKEQLVRRLLSSEAVVDSHRLRLGENTVAEEKRIMEAIGVLSEAPIYVDDSPLITLLEMRSKARRLHLEARVDLIIVDYLQLMQTDGFSRRERNRVQEISEITQGLKGLARDLNVPVLAVSQLSRAVEQRPDHRPQLSDLRESGSIEQDADVVMFIYRDDIYYSREEWERRFPDKDYPKGPGGEVLAEIIVAKHRHGPTGKVELRFEGRTARFRPLPKEKLPELPLGS